MWQNLGNKYGAEVDVNIFFQPLTVCLFYAVGSMSSQLIWKFNFIFSQYDESVSQFLEKIMGLGKEGNCSILEGTCILQNNDCSENENVYRRLKLVKLYISWVMLHLS